MIDFPNAKINIGLFVTEKRPDGYHNLETVFFPVPGLCDVLEFVTAKEFSFSVSGTSVPGDPTDNTVVKAFKMLRSDFKLPELAIHLHKKMPFGAGLGGGSADGAFMLKMLNSRFQLGLTTEELKGYARRLGADCPFFIDNKPAFGTGTGEILTPVSPDLSGYKILIIKPPFTVSTKEAYSGIKPGKPLCSLPDVIRQSPESWRESVLNRFEEHLFLIYPELERIKTILFDAGAAYASMSGSGSAVYGIFGDFPAGLEQKFSSDYFIYRSNSPFTGKIS